MPKIEMELQEPLHGMLLSLKPVIETIMEEEVSFDMFAGTIIQRGIQAMLDDIIPNEPEILMKSILLMHQDNPSFVANFINRMLEEGPGNQEAKQKLGFVTHDE